MSASLSCPRKRASSRPSDGTLDSRFRGNDTTADHDSLRWRVALPVEAPQRSAITLAGKSRTDARRPARGVRPRDAHQPRLCARMSAQCLLGRSHASRFREKANREVGLQFIARGRDASDPCHPQPGRHPVGAHRPVPSAARGDSGAWTALFLITTILTSLSGFPLPPFGFDPPRAVGVLSLILLLAAVVAYYAFHLAGIWRLIYVGCAVAALYLNVFVLVAQGFLKVPFLHDLAPTGSEPPFSDRAGNRAAGVHCACRIGGEANPARERGADVSDGCFLRRTGDRLEIAAAEGRLPAQDATSSQHRHVYHASVICDRLIAMLSQVQIP